MNEEWKRAYREGFSDGYTAAKKDSIGFIAATAPVATVDNNYWNTTVKPLTAKATKPYGMTATVLSGEC